MRVLAWLFWLLIFVLCFWVALKNADPVILRLTNESAVSAPLVIVILVAFVLGLIVGMVTASARVFRQGREIKRLKDELRQTTQANTKDIGPMTPPDVPST
jgi:lipopolysaccharide assembly protein A